MVRATLEIRVATVCADFLHLLAAAFWGGGLFHLALSLWQGLWTAPPEVRAPPWQLSCPGFLCWRGSVSVP
jgi:hypothetical protein